MAVALTALEANIETLGADGSMRSIAIGEFYRLPGETPEVETALRRDEMITGVVLPPAPAGGQVYRKVRDRASYAFALVSMAAAIDVAHGLVRDVRIAFGGVAHVPWRALLAEGALRGAPATEETFRLAADAELADARPLRDNAFKVPLARNVLVRTLLDLTEKEDQ
jgi:xanthine dehydrogenase YagS FAD-binding subunit